MNASPTIEAIRTEIEALHIFFVDWFSGAQPSTDDAFEARFTRRFDASFTLIPPAGGRLALSDLSAAIRRGHGNNPEFSIAIREVHEVARAGDLVVATYQEWQRAARQSQPPDNGRTATVVFRVVDSPDGQALRWLHVHETSLPAEVIAAADFDF